ncbi:MAG TPA: acyltransferase [Bryobacteraceae bacterium]|nr:acyltransferase [Bryobacteraceae bacterium]
MCNCDPGGRYTAAELREMLGSVGENVAINRSVIFYAPRRIHIGSNVRIDGYGILSAGSRNDGPPRIVIGDHVYIAPQVLLLGDSADIRIDSFSTITAGTVVYTCTDDYTGGAIGNPTVPFCYRNARTGDVVLERHALVGARSIIMPGVTLGLGSAVGALSFVNCNVPEFAVVAGAPARVIKQRDRRLLDLERQFLQEAAQPA